MAATIIIALLIVFYTGFVIRRKITDAKNGRFCGCGCESCPKICRGKEEGKELS